MTNSPKATREKRFISVLQNGDSTYLHDTMRAAMSSGYQSDPEDSMKGRKKDLKTSFIAA